jgi:hypothetical protein
MATKLWQTDFADCPAKLLIPQPDRIVTRGHICSRLILYWKRLAIDRSGNSCYI